MGFTDEIVSSAIGAAENKLEGKAKEEKSSFAGGCLKFIISTIWVVFTLAASIVALLAMCVGSVADFLGDESGKAICIAAIAISVLIFPSQKRFDDSQIRSSGSWRCTMVDILNVYFVGLNFK